MGVRRRVIGLAAILLLVPLTACSGGGATTSASSTTQAKGRASIPVQSGFDGDENFCAQHPLNGQIEYRVSSGRASMRIAVGGLPSNAYVGIDWVNNTVRGYLVGSVRTDNRGDSEPNTVNLLRPGETRGYKIILTSPDNIHVVGNLWPCGPPRMGTLTIANDPMVTVSPDSGLANGQTVTVTVSGFGVGNKVFLSECDHAEDANSLGCGQQLAAQPFAITGTARSGLTNFAVSARAAANPIDTRVSAACAQFCVIVATQGVNGAWAVARIAFGSSQLVNPNSDR
jgi:hypothetical protein